MGFQCRFDCEFRLLKLALRFAGCAVGVPSLPLHERWQRAGARVVALELVVVWKTVVLHVGA